MSQKEHGKKQVKKAVCGICASGCPMDVYVEDGKIIFGRREAKICLGRAEDFVRRGQLQDSTYIIRKDCFIR